MGNIKEFAGLLRPYKKKACLAFTAIVAANVLSLAFPWAIKIVIDDVLVNKDAHLLGMVTAGLVFIFILKFYFSFLREYLVSFIGERVVYDLRSRLYSHLQRLSVKYIDDTSSGKAISGIIGDVDSIKEFLFSGLTDFLYSFFNILFLISLLIILDWRLTLISSIFLPIFGITFFKLTPRLKEKYSAVRDRYAELTSGLNEALNGIRVIAGFSREKHESAKFNLKQKEIFDHSMGSHNIGIFLWALSEFMSSLGLATLIYFGSKRVFAGELSPGGLMAFYSYLGMLFFPVIKMVVVNNYYQEASASIERINEVLSIKPHIKNPTKPIFLDKIKGRVRFVDVGFGYNSNKKILSNINFEVEESQVVAIAGKSGAGKTSLINLLLRFYEPDTGSIFIDSHNIKELDLESYRSKIGIVLQDDYLFSGTIKENILYSKLDAPMEDVIKAAKLSFSHGFISELEYGYDTQAGEGGIKLSYGQRQRISIARAMLRDPAILILDEPTSNVDSETERLIIENAFGNLISGRTTFIISHRFSNIIHADKILFIENNRISERGAHHELLEKKGSYWRLFKEQCGQGILK
ncbi:MAG: ABC transporter ATP-binding protein [Candidatus Omnitrophota bacterium]